MSTKQRNKIPIFESKLYIVQKYNTLYDEDTKNYYFTNILKAEEKLYSIASKLAKIIKNDNNLKKSTTNEYHIYPYYIKLLKDKLTL